MWISSKIHFIIKRKIKSKIVIVTKNYFFLDIINPKYILYKNKMEINVRIVKEAKTDYFFFISKMLISPKNKIKQN